ncbi:MAG: carbamoyltransferase family protein [Chitinophagaceae bacterium]
MYTLGVNAVFHDSAACIIKDGELLAAAEEERFTHIKHGKRPIPFSTYELPFHAIDYCLSIANIHLNNVDEIAYSFNPKILLGDYINQKEISLPLQPHLTNKSEEWASEWDPLFLSFIVNAPWQLVDGYPHHLQKRFFNAKASPEKWHYVDHHIAHAASAFLPSPFSNAAVLTIDGRGEKTTTSYYLGEANKLIKIGEVCMPHSLGLLYESVTSYLGFLHSSDEYKVMALASYGKPIYLNDFRSMIHIKGGNYTIDELKLDERFGKARKRDEPFEEKHFNIAHSLQKVLEETVLKLVDWLYEETKQENLCMAGGVALNCVANAVIRDKGKFKNIWVQPASGDAGTALGAALWVDAQQCNNDKKNFIMHHAYWGPEYSDEEVENFLKWTKVPYRKLKNIAKETAEILAQNKVIGWFQGRMEFGPRALGSRSILASPIHPEMQAKLNEIKDREDFRPVAPVVLEEDAGEWFEGAEYSPFMLFVYNVKPDKADKIPAVRHVDGTARIQTINRNQHPLYYDLLKEFKKITGVPVLVNTSFNTRSEPIVCSPRDAIECFWTSPFDALIINSFLLEK